MKHTFVGTPKDLVGTDRGRIRAIEDMSMERILTNNLGTTIFLVGAVHE